MERILVPTDFSAPARHATDLAATLAGKAGATVIFFMRWTFPMATWRPIS